MQEEKNFTNKEYALMGRALKNVYQDQFDPPQQLRRRDLFLFVTVPLLAMFSILTFILLSTVETHLPATLTDSSLLAQPVQEQQPIQIIIIAVPSEPAPVDPLQQTEKSVYKIVKEYINNGLDFTGKTARSELMQFRRDMRVGLNRLYMGNRGIRKALALGDLRAIKDVIIDEGKKDFPNKDKIKILRTLI